MHRLAGLVECVTHGREGLVLRAAAAPVVLDLRTPAANAKLSRCGKAPLHRLPVSRDRDREVPGSRLDRHLVDIPVVDVDVRVDLLVPARPGPVRLGRLVPGR